MTERETRIALPSFIPYYSFTNERVTYNIEGKATPGKNYLDPKDILVRVYNSTIAPEGGFSGEVIALGDHVDSCGVNDYVFGGGSASLQQYITVKADEVCSKPHHLCFADASRLHAGTILYDHLQHIPESSTVLILGDMTGFAVQICREKRCFVTSSEDFNCGEQSIIDSDNFLEWLDNHDFIFDVIIDATGDLDIYDHCHKFTTKRAEYISVNPDNTLQAIRSSILPSFLGGGTRKLRIARPAKGPRKAQLLSELAAKVVKEIYEVKNPRIVSYRSASTVHITERYVTAVNVIEQKDITPEDPEYNLKDGRASERQLKNKGKEKLRRNSSQERKSAMPTTPNSVLRKSGASPVIDAMTGSPRRPSSPSSPVVHPYSPRIQSRLKHSISAEPAPEMQTLVDNEENQGSVTRALLASPEQQATAKSAANTHVSSRLSEPEGGIEMRSLSKSASFPDDIESDSEDEGEVTDRTPVLSRPLIKSEESGSRNGTPMHKSSSLKHSTVFANDDQGTEEVKAQAAARKQFMDEDDDVSDVEIDAVKSPESVPESVSTTTGAPVVAVSKTEEELKEAQLQIELLQQKVNLLLAAQDSASATNKSSPSKVKEEEGAGGGAELVEV